MKRLILLNGTMGVGKTAVCRELQKLLPGNVFLDGDWCWDMRPFVVTAETKRMVLDNIGCLLSRFLVCSAFDNVLFCWVIHEQGILDEVWKRLPERGYERRCFSLTCSEEALRRRLEDDVRRGLRSPDVIGRSLPRLPLYESMDTEKVDVSVITARQAAQEIYRRLGS
jgi:chloramphenicol 3-O-phosphotransferase